MPLEAEQATGWDIARGDVIHDRPLPIQVPDERASECPAGGMLGLDAYPVPGELLRGSVRIQVQDGLDLLQRHLYLRQRRDQPGLAQLPGRIPAVARAWIDPLRRQEP
jgi:hypothetical protein